VPSIAYGLWGSAVLVPLLQEHVNPFLADSLGKIPGVGVFFSDAGAGFSLLGSGIILAIMVTPIITAVTRDVLRTVPPELEQGAYGLGATWWQATKIVLSYAKMGIFGAIILGLARALGETMAVTMLIGNTMHSGTDPLRWSLLAPGQTIASLLASQFREADTDMFSSALFYTALLLLLITTLINGIARVLIVQVAQRATRK
ncbi:MAG: ABC transporter permease subunit, partial [Phycisphaerae bacterium]